MSDKIRAIQSICGLPLEQQDGEWGPISQAALNRVIHPVPPIKWPFEAIVDGDDLVVEDILITCFGGWGRGSADPQDNGNTASGLNTRTKAINGVSLPMDGRQFSTLSPAEHRALDGSPIPRLFNDRGLTAWHTLVEVTIDGETFIPPDGVVDLGPGLQASRPGEPHALDLTVFAALHFRPNESLRKLATNFEARGSYRIFGAAKFLQT
jgi:hypothetical protein